ncbi:MAG: GGDEF domain-containing protein [Candidatus Thiodiazotropha sp.]
MDSLEDERLQSGAGFDFNYNTIGIYAECVRVVYRNRVRSLFSVFLVSLLPLAIGWPEQTRTITFILVSLLWIYTFVNLFLCRRFDKSDLPDQKTVFWGRLFYSQLVILAILFNALFYYLNSHDVADALLYSIAITTGFSAGAVSAFHQLKWAGPLFVFFMIVPQLIYHATHQTTASIILAIMLVLFLIYMAIISLEQHRHWIKTLAISFELEAAKQEAERMARTDILTGLYNRRAFYETAPIFLGNAKRHKHPVAIVMMDIDNFKQINDTLGHSAGDIVLEEVAAILKNSVRESDIVGRMGGEEFAFLLSETDLDSAFQTIERLREDIQAIDFSKYDLDIRITSSFGIVSCEEHRESIDELLKKADASLYEAKNLGKNRTIVYQIEAGAWERKVLID